MTWQHYLSFRLAGAMQKVRQGRDTRAFLNSIAVEGGCAIDVVIIVLVVIESDNVDRFDLHFIVWREARRA